MRNYGEKTAPGCDSTCSDACRMASASGRLCGASCVATAQTRFNDCAHAMRGTEHTHVKVGAHRH